MFEIERQRAIDRVAGLFQAVFIEVGIGLPIARQPPRDQPQAANAERQIVRAQEGDGLLRCARALVARQRRQAAPVKLVPQSCGQGLDIFATRFTALGADQARELFHHQRHLGLCVGLEGVAGLFSRCLLRLGAPAGKPFGGGPVEKQRPAKQLVHRRFDLGPKCLHHLPQLRRLTRLSFELFEVVTDRLLTWDRGERAKDRRKEPDRTCNIVLQCTYAVRTRINISDAPIDFALRRTRGQGRDGAAKRRVDQHRAIDQRDLFAGALIDVAGHDPVQEGFAPRPSAFARGLCHQFVDLRDPQRREGTGKARGGAGGKGQFAALCKVHVRLCRRALAKPNRHAVFAFLHDRRAVHPQ